MKYLKLFEYAIKHTDPIAVNHILRDFSRKLEDIIIEIKDIDGYTLSYQKRSSGIVRRYFNDDGSIKIHYSDKILGRFLQIILQIEDDNVSMFIYIFKDSFKDTSLDFFNFVSEALSEYITNQNPRNLCLFFLLNDKNEILETLESFIISKKYNL